MLPTCSFVFAPQALLKIISSFFCGKGQLESDSGSVDCEALLEGNTWKIYKDK